MKRSHKSVAEIEDECNRAMLKAQLDAVTALEDAKERVLKNYREMVRAIKEERKQRRHPPKHKRGVT